MGTFSGKSYLLTNYRQVHCWEFFRGHGSTPAETGTGVPLGLPPQSNIMGGVM